MKHLNPQRYSVKNRQLFKIALSSFAVLSSFLFHLKAQGQPLTGGWTLEAPFEQKVFIENKGQFSNPDRQPLKDVQYAINNGELKVYFTPAGFSYHISNVQLNPKYNPEELKEKTEQAFKKNGKAEESLKKYFIDQSAYIHIDWVGANPDATLMVSEQVQDTYSYSVKNEKAENSSVVAKAYKKLTYKNIYPNIDIEYYFPGNKNMLGVEYNVVVHPGGDVSLVKMKYSGMQGISMDEKGNIVVAVPDAVLTDHAPGFSFVGSESNEIKARFILQGQTVSFDVPSYDKSKKLLIDPFTSLWSISPGFATSNNGYTVRLDYSQNIYVMGGLKPNYQVKKFNSAGVLQWTASTPSGSLTGSYGDMVVLRSGKAIVGMGIDNGPQAFILSPANGAVTTKNCPGGVNEFGWRLQYNQAVNNGVMWAGGGSNNGSHLIKTDTNLNAASIYNVWNSTSGSRNTEDIAYLAQDPTGNFVYITNSSNSNNNGVSGSASAPKFCKSAVGTPGTAIWQVNEPTLMMELGQGSFIASGGFMKPATGVNGMIAGNNRIYTYDGNNLRAYDDANGSIVNTATSGGAVDNYSGIDMDSCSRVYVGVNGTVKRYSSTLVFDQAIAVTDDVYDLKLDPQNDKILYATGKGFLQKISLGSYCPACISSTGTNVTGCMYGSATATVNDTNAHPPLSYLWNTTPPQTTQSITGLSAGIYIVTVTDSADCPFRWTDTVVVSGTFVPCDITAVATGAAICKGACVHLNASAIYGKPPYTISWQPGNLTGISPIVCPTVTTTYTVTITDSTGASATDTATVYTHSAVPSAQFTYLPATDITPQTQVSFTNQSAIAPPSTIVSSNWTFTDSVSASSTLDSPVHTYSYGGNFPVLLVVTSSDGCTDSILKIIDVIYPIDFPNIVTNNNDNINDYLEFKNLAFYNNNKLLVYNRWGKKMYENSNYKNEWKPTELSDGTYYYIIDVPERHIRHEGFFQLIR